MKWLWIGVALLFVVAAAAIWINFARPDFVAGLIAAAAAAAVKAAWPHIRFALKPKPFTKEQRDRIRRGADPFNKRPPGAGR